MRTHPLIDELEAALNSGTSSRRIEMLTHITDLFVCGASRYSDEQIGVFETAVRDLDEQIRRVNLNDATDSPNPEDQELAELAHAILAEHLPDDLAAGLNVYVNRPGIRIPRRWPAATPGEPVPLPASYTPHWQH